MIRIVPALAVPLTLAAALRQAEASGLDAPRRALRCGGATFDIQTTTYDMYPLAQVFAVTTPDRRHRRVDPDERSFVLHRERPGLRVLSAPIASWLCRRTLIGPVVEVDVDCLTYPDNQPDDCSATRRWSRYVTPRGVLLDRGCAPDDRRHRRIERRLGLPDVEDYSTISIY